MSAVTYCGLQNLTKGKIPRESHDTDLYEVRQLKMFRSVSIWK